MAAGESIRLYQKQTKSKKDMAQMVEHLFSKYENLNTNPSTIKREKGRKKRRKEGRKDIESHPNNNHGCHPMMEGAEG
jgi:hypothetical protein